MFKIWSNGAYIIEMVLEEACSFLQKSFLQALLSVDDLKLRIVSIDLAMIQAIYVLTWDIRHFNWSQFLNDILYKHAIDIH
jgi:hypothetical protein